MVWTPRPGGLTPQSAEPTLYQSPYFFEFRARDGFERDSNGLYLSRSRHRATFSRAGAVNSVDSNGATYSVPPYTPALRVTSGAAGLLLGTTDVWWYAFPLFPRAMEITVVFVERGSLADADDAIFYIGNAGNTGARFWIDATGTQYRLRHHNGSTERTSTMTGTAPTAGQVVQLRAVLSADGSVRLHQKIGTAAETSATVSSASSLAAAWSAERLYLNATGSTNPGTTEYRSLVGAL